MSRILALTSGLFLLGGAAAGCAGNDPGAPCDPPCPSSMQSCCDGRCVFMGSDPANCGACGNVCPGGRCVSGLCEGGGMDGGSRPDTGGSTTCTARPECNMTVERCCGASCIRREQPLGMAGRPAGDDPTSPFHNCNGCGLRCDRERAISCSIRPGGSAPECACGDFGACPGSEICAEDGGRYQCINTQINTNHCGAVGNRCAEGETCVSGMCGCGGGGRCASGQACCGGRCIDTRNDSMNCGGCGTVCGAGTTCVGGACTCGGRACRMPTMGDLGESCCGGTCVANSPSSCNCMPCDSDEMCIFNDGSGPFGGAGVCCGFSSPFGGGFCRPGSGGFDGGFGMFPDGGF